MTDIVMRKRAAVRTGEIGLFVDAAPFEEDFGHIKMDSEVQVKATTPRSLRQLKLAWALATKISDGCDWVETKEDCMDFMLIEAKHFRRIYDPRRKVAMLKPKPTNFGAMDGIEYTRLLKRLVHVAVTIMVPGMSDTDLQAEILQMVGPETAPQEQPKRQRAPRKAKESLAEGQPQREEVVARSETGSSVETRLPPDDSPPPESRPEGPTNEEEYIIAARSWIKKQTASHEDARAYFEGDHHVALRQKCGVKIGTRNLLRRELAEHYEANNG